MSGILDINGYYNNPLTGESYKNLYINDKDSPNTYSGYAKDWSKLPVYEKKELFINAIYDYQVLLIESGTGSGKTVLIPKFALHTLNYNGKIAVTIPKQIITKNNAEYAAKTLDVRVGEEVGYKFRGRDYTNPDTKLTFTTDGSLVGQILGGDKLLRRYNIVIIDEAHERNIQIDFLLYLLKQILLVRKDFKLIIMSATLPNKQLFIDYFPKDQFLFKYLFAGSKPNFKIDMRYSKEIFQPIEYSKYLKKLVEIVFELLTTTHTQNGDILAFVTSGGDAKKACSELSLMINEYRSKNEFNESLQKHFCVELYSNVSKEKELLATTGDEFRSAPGGPYNRKVVFATNVAESSLTVKGIKYVVDSGLKIQKNYDPNRMIDIMGKTLI